MADAFVSYQREDRARVEPIVRLLEQTGLSVWWDPGLRAGERFDATIARELQAARCVVVAWSATSIHSPWVLDEAADGRDRDVLVPFSLDGTRPPLGFRQFQTPDLRDWTGNDDAPLVRRLVETAADTARRVVAGPRLPAVTATPSTTRRGRRRLIAVITGLVTATAVTIILMLSGRPGPEQYAVGSIPLPSNATSMRVSPDGRTGYVVHSSTGTISVIDLTTKAIIGTISEVGTGALALAVTSDGRLGYVSHYTSSLISVIDLTTGGKVTDIDVGAVQWGIELGPDGRHVYVACRGTGLILVIDTATNRVTTSVRTSNTPTDDPVSVAVAPDGQRFYATNRGSGTVAVVDMAHNNRVTLLTTQLGPNGIAVSPDGRRAYVTNEGSDTVSDVDLTTFTITPRQVGSAPITVAFTPDSGRALVVNRGSMTVSVIDTVGGALLDTIAIGRDLGSISISPDGHTAFVTGGNFGVLFTITL